ncbi:MAG TPA: BspA family leucine-rich repeat surface protein [Chryseolinea sp.]|nr:BspA family leucine-rich repeat surface protein [Flavobacteriales bacterium]HPM30815.1 BspA family leucine-rich repeat surface protein [Chryseolinea sp.]
MKNLLSLFLVLFAYQATGQAFITTWKTNNFGVSANNQITIPTIGTGYSYSIAWESVDNTASNGTIPGPITGNQTITFPSVGIYRVSITGSFPRIYFDGPNDGFNNSNNDDHDKILTVEQWGSNVWKSMASAFKGCTYLTIPATDAPNLTLVTDMSSMFEGNLTFNQPIEHWDVSSVTDMHKMFSYTSFDQPLKGWDVSSVTDMHEMFFASGFNKPIGTWNVGSVTNMLGMFHSAIYFNKPIETWDVSNVTNMSEMFFQCTRFNQRIGSWDVSSVTDMAGMFSYAPRFNEPIGSWDVSSVTDMSNMFVDATSFNQPIGAWDMSSVTNIAQMFVWAANFNQPIGAWNVSRVINMSRAFEGATNFNQSLGDWDVSNVISMGQMLNSSGLSIRNYNQTLIGWAAQNVKPNVQLGALGLKYCAGEAARSKLIEDKGWIITGDSKISQPVPLPELSLIHPICFGSTGTITVTIQNTDDAYSFDNGVTFQANNSKSGLTEGKYSVIILSSTGCYSDSTSALINPPLDPPLPIISGSSVVCPNVTAVEYSADNDQYTYTWFVNGGTLVSQQNNTIKVDWGASNFNALVKVLGVDENHCLKDTVTFPIKIQIQLKPDLPMGMDSVCYNFRSGVPYQTSNTNGSMYTWFADGGIVTEGQTTPQVKVDWFDLGQYKLWLKEENTTSTDYCEGYSDTLNVTVFKDLAAITMNFVSVDYEDDEKVQIEWDATLLERISDLIIVSRRIAGSNAPWEIVTTLKKNVQSFLDQNVETDQNSYEYKVEGFNKCDEGLQTVIHNTIKLDGDKDEAQELIDLFWNDYNGWNGVERYEVWRKLDADTVYRLIDVTSGDITNYLGKHGADGFVHVLRIKAKKENENTISWSNEVELAFENPIDFIPNIITPNDDDENEYFTIPKLYLYPKNNLSIYDRWGAPVYQRQNYTNDWNADGLPNGTYYYKLHLVKNNKIYKGWIQIVK